MQGVWVQSLAGELRSNGEQKKRFKPNTPLHSSWPKKQKVKQKQYCNKFNKDLKKKKKPLMVLRLLLGFQRPDLGSLQWMQPQGRVPLSNLTATSPLFPPNSSPHHIPLSNTLLQTWASQSVQSKSWEGDRIVGRKRTQP